MGEHQIKYELEGESLYRFVKSLLRDLQALEKLIKDGLIESGKDRLGAEQEIFLVDNEWRPASIALDLLQEIDDPHFTTEIGLFNLEANLDPLDVGANCLSQMETNLSYLLTKASRAADKLEAELLLVGILPTIKKSDLDLNNLTPLPRYKALNHILTGMRGQSYDFYIRGLDELGMQHDSVMLEACNTSFQVHLQVDADSFANLYNTSQLISGLVLAAATNSPLLLGRRLWNETRIALFMQSIDTRVSKNYLREKSPRVTFGTKWVKESILDVYHEDIARFRPLIGAELGQDPFAEIEKGIPPELKALKLQNGTVYRWNRACYGAFNGKPHLRIECRYLPSGPSVRDEIANLAFWFGLMKGIPALYGNVSEKFNFEDAKMNFYSSARLGLNSQLLWLNSKAVAAEQLILQQLLPIAREGLQTAAIEPSEIDLYLGTIEERIRSGQTGSQWILNSYSSMKNKGSSGERLNALTAAMISRQKTGEPVSKWPLAQIEEAGKGVGNCYKVEQFMTTDVFTVQEDEPVEFAISLMDWMRVRHLPVEDSQNRLVGLVSYRDLLHLIAQGWQQNNSPVTISQVMKRNPISVSPETSSNEAIEVMQSNKIGCLPVVKGEQLVGIVTERDFLLCAIRNETLFK